MPTPSTRPPGRRSGRPRGSRSDLAGRRNRALALLDQGMSVRGVSRELGCAPSSVTRWKRKRRFRAAVAKPWGRPRKISADQARRLLRALRSGPLANGYRTHPWSTNRIAQLIRFQFQIRYHPDHVGRLMRSFGWSYTKRSGTIAGHGWAPGPAELQSWPFRKPD